MARAAKRGEMERVLARWQQSGLTGAAFCRREGLTERRLWYWRRVLRAPLLKSRRRWATKPAVLVPVRLVRADASAAPKGGLEIALGSGERLVVGEGVSCELLRDVLMVLRTAC